MALALDERKSLRPPEIVNATSMYFAGAGWASAMICNGLNHRPLLKSGAHRQVLWATIGWFIGYHVSKYENFVNAKREREMYEYIRHHPEEFKVKDKKTLAEVFEPFYPVR